MNQTTQARTDFQSSDHQRACEFADTLAWAASNRMPLPDALASLQPSSAERLFLAFAGSPFLGGFLAFFFFGKCRYQVAICRVSEALEQGKPLGYTLRKHMRRYLPLSYIAAVEQAEYSNRLEEYLPILSRTLRRPGMLGHCWETGIGYCYFSLLGIAFLIVAPLLYFITPKFQFLLHALSPGVKPPGSLGVSLAISDFFWNNFMLLVILGIFCFILFWIARFNIRYLLLTRTARRLRVWRLSDWLCRLLPFPSVWWRRRADLELTRHIALTTQVNENLIDSISLAVTSIGSPMLRCRLTAYRDRLERGDDAARAWEELNLAHPTLTWIIVNGFYRDALPEAIQTAAAIAADRLEHCAVRLRYAIFITCILGLGLLIGTISHAMFGTVYQVIRFLSE